MPQFRIFLVCIALGFFGGLLYEVFFLLSYPFRKHRAVQIISDILFCIVFAGAYVGVSVWLELPPIRFYFCLGLAFGFFLWLESLHKTLAFFAAKGYNALVRILQKRGKSIKCRKRVSLKKRKNASR